MDIKIYDVIDEKTAQKVKAMVVGHQPLTVHINSPGGVVTDGLAIYNILRKHPGHVTAIIDGLCASAATFVALAADEIVMAEHSMMMVHNPWTVISGDAIKPKPARLRGDDLPTLLQDLTERIERAPLESMLALMMLCHGTRLGETRQARWKNLNLTTRQWFIPAPDTKTKAEHTLPLTAQACALIERYRTMQQTAGYQGPLLFPGRSGTPISATNASTLFAGLAKGSWSSHDLRKVARTAWADLGVDYMVGEMLLNHAMKDLDATYIHTTAEGMKRKALETWHDHLDHHGFIALHGGTCAGHAVEVSLAQTSNGVAYSDSPYPSQGRMQNGTAQELVVTDPQPSAWGQFTQWPVG